MAKVVACSMAMSAFLTLLLSGCALGQETQGQVNAFPAGSEKAVLAVRAAVPDAVVSDVSLPQGFGAGTEDGWVLFWVVSFRSHQVDQRLKVTPDGVIIFLPRPVEGGELPSPVAAALAREPSGSKVVRRERLEARATLRYVALAKPKVTYVAYLSRPGASKRLEVAADGELKQSRDMQGGEEAEEETTEAAGGAPRGDAEVPPDASRAVAAVRAILPKMVFRGVEEVGYLDGLGEMEVLNYEVEFTLDGAATEWGATPDGIVIQVPTPVRTEAVPVAVQATLAKEPGWKVDKLVQVETRARLAFVPLDEPKVAYLVELERDGTSNQVRFRADGTRIDQIDPAALLGR